MSLFEQILAQNGVFSILSGTRLLAFVEVLLSPLQRLMGLHDNYVSDKRYELSFNGQVMYLEHILNDKYDATLRRMYISDPNPLVNQSPIITNITDNQATLTLYNIGDTGLVNSPRFYNIADLTTQFDFVLNMPTTLENQLNSIQQTLDAYKEASKIYQINLI